jgi:hypothetical protein
MKKYAILGPRLRVFRVIESETDPLHAQRFEEITDEQAQTIADGTGGFFLIDGELAPVQEHLQANRWNTDTESWGAVVKPRASLSERLRAVVGAFPPEVRAGFPFERVAYWLDQGDNETARAVIAGVDLTGYPQEILDAQTALLAEFDK